jgi:hypothetical protein
MRKNVQYVIPTVPISAVMSLCKGLEALLTGTEDIR